MSAQAHKHMRSDHRYGLALLAGCLHATSFAPNPWPAWVLAFVQCVSMAVLVYLVWGSARLRRMAGLSGAFGVGTFSVGLYWLHISIHMHGGVAWLPAALAVLLLALFESCYYVGAVVLMRYISPHPVLGAWHGLRACVAWASSWTVLEWLRGTLWTGFPWLNIAYAHTDSVLSGWASVAGAYGVTWLAAFAAATLALLIWVQQHPSKPGAYRTLDSLPSLCVLAACICVAIVLTRVAWVVPHGQVMTVRLVQGNVAQSEKFSSDLLQQQLAHYRYLAALPPKDAEHRLDLIVFPETVVPVAQDRLPIHEWQRWRDIAQHQQATLFLGIPVRRMYQGQAVYTNSIVALDATTDIAALMQGTVPRYDKAHLVPFGEFIPPGFRWFVDAMNIPLGEFVRGAARQHLFSIAGQTVAPNICYEDVFGEEILSAVRPSVDDAGAHVLINFSNLAWFGDSWALRQHLQMARMRSMETRRPMLRATNTGMTVAISAQGTVYAAMPAHTAGVLDVQVQGMQGLTPYVRWGNAPILLWLTVTLLGLGAVRWRSRQRQNAIITNLPRA